MERLPQGTGGELEEIIKRYQTTVYGLALAKTGNRTDADDVFQEVFLAYFRYPKPFADEDHRKAWLLRTTLNISKRFTASTWRKKTVPLEEQGETAVFQNERENEVWQAVAALEEGYRIPVYLYYFQGLSTREIARCMGLGEGAVRMRLSRAREQLRQSLKGDDFDE